MQPGEQKADQPSSEANASQPAQEQGAPKDALGKTNDELAQSGEIVDATSQDDKHENKDSKGPKKLNPVKKIFRKVDVYLIGFVLIIVIAGAYTLVNYLNSKKTPKTPTITSQQLSQGALKSLESTGTTVGGSAQTVTLQGNVVFSGQVLIRSDLNVAGNIQGGGTLTVPSLTVTSTANLSTTQANTLQVAQGLTVQGTTTLSNLTVSGASTFNQPITASQITVSTLIVSGTGILEVPNHIAFTGPSPGRSSIDTDVLGAGGTASVNGSDNAGTVNVNTGNDPTSGCYLTVNFNRAFTTTPHVIIGPVDEGAGETQYYVVRNTTSFSVCTANTPPANQAFAYDYWVTGT